MVTIDEDRKLVTLIVMMHVDPDLIDEKVKQVRGVAHDHSQRPGFVSCSIHKSVDNTKIVEYIQWETLAHLHAVKETFQSESPQPAGFAQRTDAGVMEIVEIVESPNRDDSVEQGARSIP